LATVGKSTDDQIHACKLSGGAIRIGPGAGDALFVAQLFVESLNFRAESDRIIQRVRGEMLASTFEHDLGFDVPEAATSAN
jgi:hypothetical protein